MHITATIRNHGQSNQVSLETEGVEKTLMVPVKNSGKGSAINGGELLFLSLATCFCNDIYREAVKRQMEIEAVEVTVSGHFGKEGEPGYGIFYTANVKAPAHSQTEIEALIAYVDTVAEIHNTLRQGVAVNLKK